MLQFFMDTIFSEYEWCLPLFLLLCGTETLLWLWFSHRKADGLKIKADWAHRVTYTLNVKKIVAHVYTFTIMCKMKVLFSWMFQSKDEYFCRIVVSLCIYIFSAVKRLITINRIQKKVCVCIIYVCAVYIYVYINTHTCMNIFQKNMFIY